MLIIPYQGNSTVPVFLEIRSLTYLSCGTLRAEREKETGNNQLVKSVVSRELFLQFGIYLNLNTNTTL